MKSNINPGIWKNIPLIFIFALALSCGNGNSIVPSAGADGIYIAAAQDQCNDFSDHGKKMQCKHQKLTDQICRTSSLVENSPAFSQRQKTRFNKQCEESQNWVNAPGRAEGFKQAFRKRNTDCYIEEVIDDDIGDDDGICTKKEQHLFGCVEDPTAAINDGDGVCEEIIGNNKKGKKRSWEVCLETCDVQEEESGSGLLFAAAADDGNELVDMERAELLENAVDGAAESLMDLNDDFVNMSQTLNVQRSAAAQMSYVYAPEQCIGLLLYQAKADWGLDPDLPDINFDSEERPYSYETLNQWRKKAVIAGTAGEICDDALSISFDVGFGAISGADTNAWCVIAHIADAVMFDVADGMELLDDTITGARIDNAVLCLQYLAENLKGIDQKLDEITHLLKMPQGQRPDFPTKP